MKIKKISTGFSTKRGINFKFKKSYTNTNKYNNHIPIPEKIQITKIANSDPFTPKKLSVSTKQTFPKKHISNITCHIFPQLSQHILFPINHIQFIHGINFIRQIKSCRFLSAKTDMKKK